MMRAVSVRAGVIASSAWLSLTAQPIHAQDTSDAAAEAGDEIIVTARKRNETSIEVPVALTAVGGEELERRAISSMDAIARVVPSLIIGDNSAQQGGIVAIRGLAGADTNPFGDQAVSFNIDGVAIGRASVRRMSEMDIQQVEVLKGPQALFFGKNSPAGIISVRSADPTSSFRAKLTTGYEFNADEIRTDGFVSGPLTDTLGIRVAGFFSDMKGYVDNIAPTSGPGVFPPMHDRTPNATEYAGRLTLKWDPIDRFSARFKLSYNKLKNDGPTALSQIVDCPLGTPQGSTAIDNCKADDKNSTGTIGPNFATFFNNPDFGNGDTFLHQNQLLSGLELNYDLTDTLRLTSMTSYYRLKSDFVGNFTNNFLETTVLPDQILASYQELKLREITEEVRLTSDFEGPFNFMLGGLYQDMHGYSANYGTARNALAPVFVNRYVFEQDGMAYSFFGQAMVDVLPTLELSVGGRYSYEKKKLPVALAATAATPLILYNITGANYPRKDSWNDFSPEVSLSWRPNRNINLYSAYKEGFLSGGFNANNPVGFVGTTPVTTSFATYDQQTIRGFEAGLKASLLNGKLRTNFALYTYKTKGLQVTVTTQGTQVELLNAGSVRTKGAEFDFTYRAPIEGLTLNGGVAYVKGRYLDYQASCYRGQPSTQCFNQVSRVTGQVGLLQDLSGTQLVRAPEWSGNAGFDYETPITDGLKIGLSGNMSFSSGYFTNVPSSPGGRQDNYQLFDASIRLAQADDRWEVALIGRNLTDEFYFVRSTDLPFTGTNPGCAPLSPNSPANCLTNGLPNSNVTNPFLGDTGAVVTRGREVMLRFTVRLGN